MTRRLVIAMTLLVAAVALALAIPIALIVDSDQRAAFVAQLEVDTLTTASVMGSQPSAEWPATAREVAQRTGSRVVVVDDSGVLVADSDQTALDRSFDRPEITAALGGTLSSDVQRRWRTSRSRGRSSPTATRGSTRRRTRRPRPGRR